MDTVLCSYRITPQTSTGESPSELLFCKRLRTRLDLLKPNLGTRVENKRLGHKTNHDISVRAHTFVAGDKEEILVRE